MRRPKINTIRTMRIIGAANHNAPGVPELDPACSVLAGETVLAEIEDAGGGVSEGLVRISPDVGVIVWVGRD
jgi:hypothetical protein